MLPAASRSRTIRALVIVAVGLGIAAYWLYSVAMPSPQATVSMPREDIGVAKVASGLITAEEWLAYRNRFIVSGRVVDDANGNISHSEGQGYGMMLAVMANDRSTFNELWHFVRTQLMVRDDGLAAWRWNPASEPRVTDVNNATDGDILIAYALLLGAATWDMPDLAAAARPIIDRLTATVIVSTNGWVVLLPGVEGFSARAHPDGPVINPSYWVFEAMDLFARVHPQGDAWEYVAEDGLALIDRAGFGPRKASADWISLRNAGKPQLTKSMPAEYGYNALRIPLYLLRAGIDDRHRLERFRNIWMRNGRFAPAIMQLDGKGADYRLDDPGYTIIAASLSCALDGTPIPAALRQFTPTLYYPSTLHLLSLTLIRQRYPQCL